MDIETLDLVRERLQSEMEKITNHRRQWGIEISILIIESMIAHEEFDQFKKKLNKT